MQCIKAITVSVYSVSVIASAQKTKKDLKDRQTAE